MPGTLTLQLAHYLILQASVKVMQQASNFTELSPGVEQIGGPTQDGYVMMCMRLMIGSLCFRQNLHCSCVRAMQQLNGI